MTKPTMEHRHFKLIAQTIAALPHARISIGEAQLKDIVEHFANALSDTNSRFDRERFIAAALGTPSNGRDRT